MKAFTSEAIWREYRKLLVESKAFRNPLAADVDSVVLAACETIIKRAFEQGFHLGQAALRESKSSKEESKRFSSVAYQAAKKHRRR